MLRKALNEHRFVCVVEFVPRRSADRLPGFEHIMQRSTLCGWPMVGAIADRVSSSDDLSPPETFSRAAHPFPTLLHFSGKNRERRALLEQLDRMDAAGLDQLLILTGDRVPGHEPGQPVRYLESVSALQIVRKARPNWLLGAALNPFKYQEDEGGAQYFKADKKLLAGADFLTLQLGFDAQKHQEAQTWMQQRPAPVPLLACVMALTARSATLLEHVPGVTVTPSMHALLAAEAAVSPAYARERSLTRLGVQIIGLELMGYAGIHLSGIHTPEQLHTLEQTIKALKPEIQTLEQWRVAWARSWQMPGVAEVTFHPEEADWRLGESRSRATRTERVRYHALSAAHSLLFSCTNPLSRGWGWLLTRNVWQTPRGKVWLHRVERGLKRPTVGCDTCGTCRLEDTLYICPETCPKGLANGPCGGTRLNRCEFGDRECIHSVKYRTAKAIGQTQVLTERLIPCVDADARHQSSWPQWFDASSPQKARGDDSQR
ncbi:methylenetetrahydrofolate reductase C-terminal domain-containing protein [Larsenimonas suaedae]|uniref:Methylenetetrahydrofolate reductase n=1 Tax=Larsenimonas suaedae TaxID=1851019 RepID=A0ABU1GSU6_9GAMM|nr:methylenetetrahydrofolate reductase C-terminal domain-containing protein [Larsenimonas suaedae]MCM2972542.1 methylenetetrahydrofolate reductase C-terminal domain-containing protein [Larsenimonas suaedae]MDR5894662.1 methylenetetrahydrofolate reductase C-terminal domain-containing protein [Larsenimonas suaedae]